MDFEVRKGSRDDVKRLAPLWRALRDHHATLPEMPPVRSLEDSWEHRKGQYLDWLTKDEYTLLLAERDGEPIGYAMVSVGGGAATWDVGERTAEVETLSVLESERGSGVGRALDRSGRRGRRRGRRALGARRGRALERGRAPLLRARGLRAVLRVADPTLTGQRRSAKNSVRSCFERSASRPAATWGRWLRRGSPSTSSTLPAAPALGSGAP